MPVRTPSVLRDPRPGSGKRSTTPPAAPANDAAYWQDLAQRYTKAARALGVSTGRILWRHILPSTIPALMVQGATVCASAIMTEAALSFLGVGVPPEIPSWGNMIASSRLYLGIAPLTIFAPGICLAVTVLAVNLLGDGLRDLFDPRAKGGR